GKLADAIPKERAVIGCFDEVFALNVCTGKSALFMADALTFQNVLGNGVAVDRDNRAILARAAMMNCRRRHLFAGAGLSEQEHRGSRPGYLANESKDCLHLWTGAEHIFKHIGSLALL